MGNSSEYLGFVSIIKKKNIHKISLAGSVLCSQYISSIGFFFTHALQPCGLMTICTTHDNDKDCLRISDY